MTTTTRAIPIATARAAILAAGADGLTARAFARSLGHDDPAAALRALGAAHRASGGDIRSEWATCRGEGMPAQHAVYFAVPPADPLLA